VLNNTGAGDAASSLFNLDDYAVLGVEGSGDSRSVLVEPRNPEAPCPACGVLFTRIQARPVHRVKDVVCGGKGLEVLVRKRCLVCQEDACPNRTFVPVTEQIPLRSRLTTRVVGEIVEDAVHELRAVTGIARVPNSARAYFCSGLLVLPFRKRRHEIGCLRSHEIQCPRCCEITHQIARTPVPSDAIWHLASDVELGVVYALKEHVRELLKTRHRESFVRARAKLEASVKGTGMHEAKSLFRTFTAWKAELETFCLTRLTNARSEAASLTAQNIKRIGRGYVNHHNYRCGYCCTRHASGRAEYPVTTRKVGEPV
jgi:transposase